ncbi:MAG: 50S ribosomal protein L3 [Clostridia bacterium]
MNKAIIGKKLGMSQIFEQDGTVIPVTVVEAGPCPVVQKKTKETDGYCALQVAFGDVKVKRVNKAISGHYKKASVEAKKYLREFKFSNVEDYKIGQVITCDIFAVGDKVDVTGTSKGHGFSGTIKRWNFHCGPLAHGSGYHRGVGSLGANSSPSRVFKNKKMPGQYGNEKSTIQNLKVVKIDKDRNLLLIKGAVPGSKGGIVIIKQSVKG